jgi:hypothetical protein
VNGFAEVAATAAPRSVIVWVNEFFGRVEYQGKQFADMKAYKDHQDRVCGSVGIPRRNYDTFGRDVEEVIAQKLTFEEAIRDGSFSVVTKQRLKMVERELFEQLDLLDLE